MEREIIATQRIVYANIIDFVSYIGIIILNGVLFISVSEILNESVTAFSGKFLGINFILLIYYVVLFPVLLLVKYLVKGVNIGKEFVGVDKNFSIAKFLLVLFVIPSIFPIILFSSIMFSSSAATNSPSYQAAIDFIVSEESLVREVSEIKKLGKSPYTNNHNYKHRYKIEVIGSRKTIFVDITLKKVDDTWEVIAWEKAD
jgi:hypothetical protein